MNGGTPADIGEFLKALGGDLADVRVDGPPPGGGTWWIDFTSGGFPETVAWRRDEEFGLWSEGGDAPYGAGPDRIVAAPAEAARAVLGMLAARTMRPCGPSVDAG